VSLPSAERLNGGVGKAGNDELMWIAGIILPFSTVGLAGSCSVMA